MNASKQSLIGVLLLSAELLGILTVVHAQQGAPSLAASVQLNRSTYLFTGGPDPIQLTVSVQNISGGPLVVGKSLTSEILHRTLTFIDPDGHAIVANDFGVGDHEGGPPPIVVVGDEFIQVEPVITVPANGAFTVTLADARTFFTFPKPGRYRVQAVIPARVFSAVFRTVEDGTVYARRDTLISGEGLFSNTVEFFLVIDADGDGYAYPVPDSRISAQTVADCNDENAAIHPGAPEIPGDGFDNDCNPSTSDDGSAPVTSAKLQPGANANGWNKTDPTVILTAVDGVTVDDVASVNYTLTGATTGGQTVPGATATFTITNQGTTTVSYFAKDKTNNQESAHSLLVRLDKTAPSLTVPANMTVGATSAAGAVVTYTTTATDNLDPSPTKICTPASGSTFPIGTTTVSCTATDQAGNSVTKTFTVTVTGGGTGVPVAVGQTATTNEDTAKSLTLAASDSNSASLTFSIVTAPTKGTLSALSAPSCVSSGSGANCTGTTTYTPNANVNGTDSFTFRASDGTNFSAPATVNLTITAINDPPTFNAIANQTVATNASARNISITGVVPGPSTATDEASQSVTLSATSSNPAVVPNPTITGTGSTRALTYQPVANATGFVTITVTANDGQAANNTFSRTFTIQVFNSPAATTQINNLIAKVQGLSGVTTSLKNSLINKLQTASKQLPNQVAGACDNLNLFIEQVNAQSGKGLTPTQANDLKADANQIKATLGCQ
jgi:hypothetical protein